MADGKTTVAVRQTADKAILSWERFNVGRNTTVDFQQQADWAVLNRNGIVFSGSSQVDAAAPSPWRVGVLSFRNTALTEVVSEINRYRPGRVLLLARALADWSVSRRFVIPDLDKALAQRRRLFPSESTGLPGGVVLLGWGAKRLDHACSGLKGRVSGSPTWRGNSR